MGSSARRLEARKGSSAEARSSELEAQKTQAGRCAPGLCSHQESSYLSQVGSPSPAPGLTGLAVATEMPQVMPGIWGCVSVADQYDVLGAIVGTPTPDVVENLSVTSASVP